MPPYIRISLVAKACEVPLQTARRMLVRAGITERLGHLLVVGDGRLRERLPEVYERVFSYIALQSEENQSVSNRVTPFQKAETHRG
jgi:hypothetical protein